MRNKLNTFLFLVIASQAQAQINSASIDSLTIIRQDFRKPANWEQADKYRNFYYDSYPKSMNLQKALSIIKNEKDFTTFLQAKTWCIDSFRISVPKLIILLTDTTKVGLKNTGDLIIWDRVNSGDLKYYGHGGVIYEDIFTIAGRASYILHELTGESFALVNMKTSKDKLKVYQEIWHRWFLSL